MLLFDLETDGLLNDATKIHCLCIYDTDTEKTMVFNDQSFTSATERPATEPIVRGIQYLEDSNCIVGHNIINYDLSIINKFYPWFTNYDYYYLFEAAKNYIIDGQKCSVKFILKKVSI